MRVITRLNIGGPSIHTLLLTRELAALDYRTVLVAGSCEVGDGDMAHSLQPGDQVHWVAELSRSVRPWRNLQALWKLWRIMRRERPAIVHTHTAMAGCLGRLAALLSGVPIIVHTFHGNTLTAYFSTARARVFRVIEKRLAQVTDVLCVVSPQQAAELSGKLCVAPAYKFRVVPLGLELEDYFGLRPPAGNGPLTVGWFGRMVPVKNLALLAATIKAALQRCEKIRFIIAGDGPDRALLDTLADLYGGRVALLGWQSDILPAMSRCDVVLQTSRNEGTPVALIQAMAAARPFVSTAVGGVVDMVSGHVRHTVEGLHWYANGVLSESNAAALANALTALAEDPALVTQMGLAGRAVASGRYRKERLVNDVDSLYRELLQRRKRV